MNVRLSFSDGTTLGFDLSPDFEAQALAVFGPTPQEATEAVLAMIAARVRDASAGAAANQAASAVDTALGTVEVTEVA